MRYVLRFTGLLVILFTTASARAAEPTVAGDRLEFAIPDLEGDTVSSTDDRFAGRVVFVTLWGTFCPPCITEVPTFIDLQDRYGDSGLVILAISFEREKEKEKRRAMVREFVNEHEVNYLVLDGGSFQDFEGSLPGMRDVEGFPVEVLIDRCGQVVDSRNGYGYRRIWAKHLEQRIVEQLECSCESEGN